MMVCFRSRRDVWRAEDFHHAGQRLHQVIHEVLDAAFAAAEMPLQALTHDAPAESRSVGNRNIHVLHAQHALLDEVEHFSIERRLQAVGHVAREVPSAIESASSRSTRRTPLPA